MQKKRPRKEHALGLMIDSLKKSRKSLFERFSIESRKKQEQKQGYHNSKSDVKRLENDKLPEGRKTRVNKS